MDRKGKKIMIFFPMAQISFGSFSKATEPISIIFEVLESPGSIFFVGIDIWNTLHLAHVPKSR